MNMPHIKPHLPEILIKYFHNKELDELYLSVFLKSLAESLINIFIPIYLLQLGYGIFDIAVYFIIHYSAIALFMPLGMSLNAKIGIKKTMALGTFCYIFGYYLLNRLEFFPEYQWVAFVLGISIGFYFSAFHIEYTKIADRKSEGKELSVFKIIAIVAAVLGPFVGSLVISGASFHILFLIVAALLLASIVPLFFTKDFKIPERRISFKNIVKADSPAKALVYQADGIINLVSTIFWPVFIYLTISEITFLGGIISLTSFLMIAVVIYIGKLVDKNNGQALKIGVFTHAPLWILRIFLLSPLGLFFSNLLNSISLTFIGLSFGKIFYGKAKDSKNLVDYFLFRDFNLNIGRIILLFICLFTQSITWMFIIAFIVTFAHLLSLKEIKAAEKK